MNTLNYIKTKQKNWAIQNNIMLQGSKIEKGDPIYARKANDNFFQPISKSTRDELIKGDGNELGDGNMPGKIQALHSSSALGINVFEYWKVNKKYSTLAKALKISTLGIEGIEFEEKFEIFKNAKKSPNIDVVVHYKKEKIIGIECKFTEPFQFRNQNSGLKEKYINDFMYWNEFENLKMLAEQLSPNDDKFEFLHCAQLIKHVLGMYTKTMNKNQFKLMYIYQPAVFENNTKYEEEINLFKDVMVKDNVEFHSLTWQDLFRNLVTFSENNDNQYVNYLMQRYF